MPNLVGAGAERVAVNLANGFALRGYVVDMVLMSCTGEFLPDLQPEVRIVDLKVKRFRGVLFPLTRYLLKSRPDVLLACMWPLTVTALLARVLASVNTRVVVAEHTTWSRDEIAKSAFGRWMVRTTMHHAFPQSNGVVTVSQGAAEDLARFARLDRKAITVIYNPVAGDARLPTSEPQAPAEWWTGPHCKLLAVGSLSTVKDYATSLSALAILRQRISARLLILGEGTCRFALEARARALGIADSVFMPGFVKNPSPYYQHADLLVVASTCEGFGNVIVEALAAGTPVVSTDCPSGPAEILSGGKFGRLVPIGNSEALAAAMAASLAGTHDTSALQARAQDFSIDKAVDRYLQLFFSLAPAKGQT